MSSADNDITTARLVINYAGHLHTTDYYIFQELKNSELVKEKKPTTGLLY